MSYVSLHKSQLLDSLESQVLYAELVCVIIGQKGIGKSFFLEQLYLRTDELVYTSKIQADKTMTQVQLEKSISLQLGLSWQDSEQTLLQKIESSLEHRALLTIDDAHQLSTACLDFLLALADKQLQNKKTSLYIILAGETTLANHISDTAMIKTNPGICIVFELESITLAETKRILEDFQFNTAENTNIDEEEIINQLWHSSHGVPGELKRLSEEGKEALPPNQQSNFFKGEIDKRQYLIATGYVVLAVILGMILVFQDEVNQVIVPEPKKTAVSEDKMQSKNTVIAQETKEVGKSISSVQTIQSEPEPEQKIDTENFVERKVLEKTQQVLTPDLTNQIEVEPRQQLKVNKNDRDKSVDEKTESLFQLSKDEKNLLELGDSLFTLQWMGLSELNAAKKFRTQHPLQKSIMIFRRLQNSGYLYLLVSGPYKSRNEAERVREDYIKRGYSGPSPWVKSTEAVKQEILMLTAKKTTG